MNISIIIPAYNREKTIEKCIKSISKGLNDSSEIIIVDDGSSDETIKICESLEKENIRLIKQNHGGVSAARNIGIENARGEYIAFADSDDYVGDDYVDILEAAIKDKPQLVVFNSFEAQGQNGSFKKYDSGLKKCKNENIKNIYNALICQKINTVWHKIYRKDIICKNCLKFNTDMIIAEDFMFVTDYIKCCGSYSVEEYIPYYFCFNMLGTYKARPEHLKNLITAYENTKKFISAECPDADTELMKGRFLQQSVETVSKLYDSEKLTRELNEEFVSSTLYTDLTCQSYNKIKSKIEKTILKDKNWKTGSVYSRMVKKLEKIV